MIVLLRLLLALLALLPAAVAPVTEPQVGYGLAQPVQSEPALPYGGASQAHRPPVAALARGMDGPGDAPFLDASAVTFEGVLAYAAPSHGPLYLAIRQPRGTRVEVCGPASCLTRISTDFGPTLEMARQGRIADVSSVDFSVLCGVPLSFGVCNGTLTLVGLPATDLEGSHD